MSNKWIYILLPCSMVYKVYSQTPVEGKFKEMRKKEFSKLIGGIQEGANLEYSAEKTILEGSLGQDLKKTNSFIQFKGSIGTSTNLSNLFSSKQLPTFSGSATWHILIPGFFSRFFYDGNFISNQDKIYNGESKPEDISTGSHNFEYSEFLRERLENKKIIEEADRLYTFKRFTWMSLTAKYDNSKYSFYNSAASFGEQLTNPLYSAWGGQISVNNFLSWNHQDFKWKFRPRFTYFSLNLQYAKENNISILKKTTVNDILSSSTDGTTKRDVVKSTSAYNGLYSEFLALTPSFEVIVSPIKSFALNFFGDYKIINNNDKTKNNLDNIGSIASGIYFYSSGSTKINLGAFYKWTHNKKTNDWVEVVGLKTSIPISVN